MYGVVTLYDTPFQEFVRRSYLLDCTSDYNSRVLLQSILNLSCCLFTRRYWGNLC